MRAGRVLPPLWAGRADCTVLVTHVGLGHALLALCEVWRGDARRPERLHLVALAPQAPTAAEMAQAHAGSPLASLASALMAVWPPSGMAVMHTAEMMSMLKAAEPTIVDGPSSPA